VIAIGNIIDLKIITAVTITVENVINPEGRQLSNVCPTNPSARFNKRICKFSPDFLVGIGGRGIVEISANNDRMR
jgi:hypothetical protein